MALLLMAGLLLALPTSPPSSMESLLAMQKSHDLLRLWQFQLGQEGLAWEENGFDRDFRRAFPGRNGELEIFWEGRLIERIELGQGESQECSLPLSVDGLFFLEEGLSLSAFQFRLTDCLN